MKKQKGIRLFQYDDQRAVREIEIKKEPWFVAKDACDILDISNVSDALEKLDEDEKLLSPIPIAGQRRNMLLVSESGLYHLILTSNKPEAKNFRRWITKVVLPQIRKTGSYSANRMEVSEMAEKERRRRDWKKYFDTHEPYQEWRQLEKEMKAYHRGKSEESILQLEMFINSGLQELPAQPQTLQQEAV